MEYPTLIPIVNAIGAVATPISNEPPPYVSKLQIVGLTNSPNVEMGHISLMPKTSPISGKLKTLRALRRRTAAEVADAIGISRSFLSGIEAGHDNPGRETLKAFATYYDVSLDWLTENDIGLQKAPFATARSEDEALLLSAYRSLPSEEAKALLNLLLSRLKHKI